MISSRQVISKVFADLDIKEGSNRQSDMIEWVGEAVEKIGSVRQLKRVVSGVDGAEIVQLKNHQAKLPMDLFRLNQVMYSPTNSGPFSKMIVATGNINAWSGSSGLGNSPEDIVRNSELVNIVKILYSKYAEDPIYAWFSKMDNEKALEILNTNQNVRTLLVNLIQNSDGKATDSSVLKYSIKPGYINTNVRDGFIKFSYDAIPADEDGYPLVPDMVSYSEAIYWYIVMKLSYPEYRSGKMRQDIYFDAKRSWNFYCKQAYGESMMPNSDEMESIKNQWNRLIPELGSHAGFYEDTDEAQTIYNKN